MTTTQQACTVEEAIAALRAAVWTERNDPDLQRAVNGDKVLTQHDCNAVREFDEGHDTTGEDCSRCGKPGTWWPLFIDMAPPPRKRIHTMTGGVAIGANWDLSAAEEFVRSAREVGWVRNAFSHDLRAVGPDGYVILFDVPNPDRQNGASGRPKPPAETSWIKTTESGS
jgi:hypothetical protein